jgi:hypothetical protein
MPPKGENPLEALSQQLLVTPFRRHHSRMPGFCYLKIASTPNRVFMRDVQSIHLHRPRGHPGQGRTASAGISPDSEALTQVAQGTCSRRLPQNRKPGPIAPNKIFSDANRWKNHCLRMSCLGRDGPPGPQPISSSRATHDQMENPSKLRARSREDPEDLWPGNDYFRDRLYDVRKDLSTANFLTFRNQEPF